MEGSGNVDRFHSLSSCGKTNLLPDFLKEILGRENDFPDLP